MGRTLPILAVIALVLAALAASLITGVGLIVVAAYGIVVAVFLFLTRDTVPMAVGGVGVLLLVLAILGLLGGVSTEEGGLDFGISDGLGTAFLIAGMAALAGGALAVHWGAMDPDWLGWVGVAVLTVAAVLAFVAIGSLGDMGSAPAMASALLLLVGIWPLAVALKAE